MFEIGDRVVRLEDREIVGATIVAVDDSGAELLFKLEYDEGGTGWWPISAVERE